MNQPAGVPGGGPGEPKKTIPTTFSEGIADRPTHSPSGSGAMLLAFADEAYVLRKCLEKTARHTGGGTTGPTAPTQSMWRAAIKEKENEFMARLNLPKTKTGETYGQAQLGEMTKKLYALTKKYKETPICGKYGKEHYEEDVRDEGMAFAEKLNLPLAMSLIIIAQFDYGLVWLSDEFKQQCIIACGDYQERQEKSAKTFAKEKQGAKDQNEISVAVCRHVNELTDTEAQLYKTVNGACKKEKARLAKLRQAIKGSKNAPSFILN